MENIILFGMLRDFITRHGLEQDALDKQFEKFVNYCLLKTEHYDSFDFDKVGTGNCVGIDGVAVSINGVITDEIKDLENFTKAQFEARFIFSQAKTSPNFDLGEFLKFISTVHLFFGKDKSSVPAELHKTFDIKTYIYERAAAKLRQSPMVELNFVYTGKFDGKNKANISQIDSQVSKLRDIPYLFYDVKWNIYDGDQIARLYRETQNEHIVSIQFQRHIALPKMIGAKSAYLGVVRCSDYVDIIKKGDGNLNKGLFFENVRDFLGTSNPVNEEIAKTINKPEERNRFAILNNGVTIVAKGVIPSGDNFRISQFQVVNGCQTSHVLFYNKDSLTDDMYLTVKLVETSDIDLSGQIISTTNSQSLVTKEAFATIRPYHRLVEDFFNAMRNLGYKYYYERRPHQYDGSYDIQQQHIISAPSLIKSFVSNVLEEPHKVHYYYGTLLSEYNRNRASELFSEDDYPGLYFASHHITFCVRSACSHDNNLKNWVFHLALLLKRVLAPELKRGMSITDKKFLDLLHKVDANFDKSFRFAADFIKLKNLNSDENRSSRTTATLLADFSRSWHTSNIQIHKHQKGNQKVQLQDGRYIGVLKKIISENNMATVQYGPFQIEGIISNHEVSNLSLGVRVAFIVLAGQIKIEILQQA